ncbi:hypothetical protein A5893_17430 [Pedobacter psychrophilus]|uniref:Uncharacterized protein n=2 Tax=Pedobacter psychrophilus TaxID=1826909 RepID=A0A179DG94_9SPHI|nr:hypothetical protein A5893_17430 [Pedobacter psychrophilus]
MLKTRLNIFLTIFFLWTLSSCHPLGCSWDFGYTQLKVEPNESKLIGIYILSEKSKSYLKDHGLNPEICILKLNADKSFNLENVPSSISNDDLKGSDGTQNKYGTWSVSCDKSYDCMIELQGTCVVPLCEKDDRISIPITIGDGDECNGIVFEKR